MTVGELIAALAEQGKSDLNRLVVLRIFPEWSEDPNDATDTFITAPEITMRGGQQTYLGDRDILRISFKEDEP